MNYRDDPYDGDELARMRERQQRKKRRMSSGQKNQEPGYASKAADRPDDRDYRSRMETSDDLTADQIEELDLDDYDTYENALEQELSRTIAQTQKTQGEPIRRQKQDMRRQSRPVYKRPGRGRRKRRSVGMLLILLVCLFAGIFLYRHLKDDGYWTIAVFGVDSRDGNLGKGALSDVEMVASINKKTGEIRLVSVFRDSYLRISDQEDDYDKINEAYFLGGHDQAVHALESNLNLKIDDYATFNWKAVVDAINVLGGVDLEITDKEFAYINSFITETVNSTGVGSYQLEHSGMNHLDGVQAVAYARLRLMDTDFNRTERQRKVLGQAMEKAKASNFKTLRTLVGAVYPQISTSIGVDDVLTLAKGAKKYYIGQTSGFPFSHQEMKIGKKSCVIPTTLESNVVQLHTFLYDQDQYDAPASVKEISDYIAAKTGLGEPGKDTESGKNVGAEGNSGGGQTSSKAEQPVTTQPQTDPATETGAVIEESSETEETMSESTQSEETNETESSSGVIQAPKPDADASKPTASGSAGEGPGASNGQGTSAEESKTTTAPTAPETKAALEAPGQNSEAAKTEVGPGV